MTYLLVWLLLAAPNVPLSFTPERVHPGDSYLVSAPALAGSRIDLRYRFRSGLVQEALGFCQLDERGEAHVSVPANIELGTVEVTGIRPAGTAEWLPVEVHISVEPDTRVVYPATLQLLRQKFASQNVALLLAGLLLAWLLAEAVLRTRQLSRWRLARLTRWEYLLILLAAGLIACQILLPPAVGLADNGDFPKIAGRFSLGPEDTSYDSRFFFLNLRYAYRPAYHWNSQIPSSEVALAALPAWTSRLLGKDGFDLRALGVVHALLFVSAFALLLLFLRQRPKLCRIGLPLLVLFLFTDLAYVSYFNSFYADAGAFVFLLLTVVSALLLTDRVELGWLLLFGIAAAFLITSKSQHALLAVPLALFAVRSGFASGTAAKRAIAAGLAVILLSLGAWMLRETPWSYKAQASFNLIFFDELRYTSDPAADLRRLGLGPEEMPLIGMNAFQPDSPASNSNWLRGFAARTGHASIARLYLSEPHRALERARRFSLSLYETRQRNLANFQKQDGFPAGTISPAFSLWSQWKSAWLIEHPLRKVCACFLIFFGATLLALFRSGVSMHTLMAKVGMAEVGLLLLTMAAIEFLLSCYGDAVENGRHLFLFHALADMMVCLGAGAVFVAASPGFAKLRERRLPARA